MAFSTYLAGPEVFLENAKAIGEAKCRICDEYGLKGVFPLDKALDLAGLSPEEAGLAIYRANRELMDGCDLVIANMTPFRGPSMDVGTAFEMGYMRGLGRPVFGYSNVAGDYLARVEAFYQGGLSSTSGHTLDPNGMTVEPFRLADNLMLEGAVRDFGTP
ncbi:MAG: nucleoside 2-deoxyribosyltransferase, partial [Kiloniellales bacterium]